MGANDALNGNMKERFNLSSSFPTPISALNESKKLKHMLINDDLETSKRDAGPKHGRLE